MFNANVVPPTERDVQFHMQFAPFVNHSPIYQYESDPPRLHDGNFLYSHFWEMLFLLYYFNFDFTLLLYPTNCACNVLCMQCINNQEIIIALPLSLNDSGSTHPSSSSSSSSSARSMLVPMRLFFVCITFPASERCKIYKYTFVIVSINKFQILKLLMPVL